MMDRQQTAELYEQILVGCAVAEHSLRALMRRAQQQEIMRDMAELRQQYAQIAGEAQKGLRAVGGQTPAAKLPRLGNCMTIYCKTMLNRSPENLARIVIRGFQTGDRELRDYRREYINAEEEAKMLCAQLLEMQQRQKMRFRRYLN